MIPVAILAYRYAIICKQQIWRSSRPFNRGTVPTFSTDILTVEVKDLLIGLIVGTVLSSILAWHYLRFGRTMTSRTQAAYAMPIITLTIVLIISVVKSSIALSLGLVGALSIVRFRTPIKEPEELAYLFVAIGVGIGLGAGQTWPTVAAATVILFVMSARLLLWSRDKKRNLYVNIDVRGDDLDDQVSFERITELLDPYVQSADLRRLDVGSDFVQATLYVRCNNDKAVAKAMSALKEALPDATTITFIEQSSAPVV
jgi:uncharacterized membrane protein YhiD involved in acid resistance